MAARAKPFERSLAISNERRSSSKLRLASEPGKGRPPLRQCPPDFDVVFVEVGRLDCETFYRAARVTIDRWLLERGKERLIRERALYVEHQRKRAKANDKAKLEAKKPASKTEPKISLCVARSAARFLSARANGSWVVAQKEDDLWIVGTMRKTTAELVDMASARGFSVEIAENECVIEPADSPLNPSRSGSSAQRGDYYDSLRARFLDARGNVEAGIGSNWQDDDDDWRDEVPLRFRGGIEE